jgi:hypothetical protein
MMRSHRLGLVVASPERPIPMKGHVGRVAPLQIHDKPPQLVTLSATTTAAAVSITLRQISEKRTQHVSHVLTAARITTEEERRRQSHFYCSHLYFVRKSTI